VTNDDVLYRSRLRLFALAKEMGSVRAACRMLGVHHSTYYRWQRQPVRFGTEILRPRERRRPRMPNAISPMVEHRVLALALANPGGPTV
jgi:transposase